MNRKILLWMVLALIAALMVMPTFAAEKLYKIAVLPFDDGSIKDRWWGGNWEVGKGVSDELVTALLDTRRFRLIEREQIDKVINEQNFGTSGRVDSGSAAKIGKILGVDLLVMGRVTQFSFKSSGAGGFSGPSGIGLSVKQTNAIVNIDARLVQTSTAEIIAAVTGKGEKKQTNVGIAVNWSAIRFGSSEFRNTHLGLALREAVVQVANGLAERAYGTTGNGSTSGSSGIQGLVAYVSGTRVIINIGSGDGVQQGMVFVIHHVIDMVKDPKTGEVIDEVTEPVAEISVNEVKEKTSTCTVMTRYNTKYPIANGDMVKLKN